MEAAIHPIAADDMLGGCGNCKLNVYQKIILRIVGYVKIGVMRNARSDGFSNIYVAKCSLHGIYVDIPHGASGELRCRKCEERFLVERFPEVRWRTP
jgi:hypothetical protein